MLKTIVLIIALICLVIFGYWLMGKFGKFFDNNRRKRWYDKS